MIWPVRRCLLLLALTALALGAHSPSAGAASRPDARAFTKATLAFDLKRGKAIGRAERRGDARRRTATACLRTLRQAPARRREELFRLYVTWVGAGYFTEDEPAFARWLRALARIPTTDPALRRARTTLGRQLTRARATHGQGRRFCTPVEDWARAGWTEGARPRPLRRLAELDPRAARSSRLLAGISAASRILRSRGGEGGALAGSVLREGVDEPDEQVIQGDDPIVKFFARGF